MSFFHFDKIQYATDATYPLFLWLYTEDGKLPPFGAERVENERELNTYLQVCESYIREGREVRIVDRGDMMVFHARNGKIEYPQPKKEETNGPA
jgi:hypothetical protein